MSYKLINYCEIDSFASQSYSRIHNVSEDLNLGDITLVDTSKIEDFDLLVGGSPCFTGDTLVLTNNGYKEIRSLNDNDKVLTIDNSYQKVEKLINQGMKNTYTIKTMCSNKIKTTLNHKFWVRKKYFKNGKRYFEKPEWKTIEELMSLDEHNNPNYKNYYVGSPINQNSIIPKWNGIEIFINQFTKSHLNNLDLNDENLWYIVGRYLGDGWLIKNRKGKFRNNINGFKICCAKNELEELKSKINKNYNYHINEDKSTYKLIFSNTEFANFLAQFGEYAYGKYLPGFVFDLPINLLKSMLNGYFDADGNFNINNNKYRATSVSKLLIFGLSQCIQKVYHQPISIYYSKRKEKYKIENRIVNQKDSYEINFINSNTSKRHAFFEDNTIWYPIQYIENNNIKEEVFDITVSHNHSFTANNCIVHNCQDFSSSGKKAGAVWTCKDCGYEYNPLTAHFKTRNQCPHCNSQNLERTRSSLIVEYLRILRDKMPKFAIYENVKNLIGKEFKPTFDLFVKELEEYGYNVYYQVLNAKYYGVPQNRERIILVAIRKDIDNGKFKYPEPFDSGIRLKDVLATRIEDKFYISKDKTEKLLNNLEEDVKEKLFKSMNNINNISLLDSQAKRKCLEENNSCEDCQLKYIYGNEINKIDLIDSVKVRKYEVNVSALKELLSTKKKELKLTNKEISEILNIPKTTVDHWFRKDDSFAIPDSNIWFKLKDLLQIKTNSFDKSITEFIEKENMYEKSNRAYLVDGISPTLTTVNTDEKVIYPCAMIACEPRTDGMVLFNDNVCGTLRTIRACGDKHIIEGISEPMELPLCCASRGRNPENPNSRISGLPTQQRLELNSNNTTNTLTTVQKDNYILEPCALKYERTEYGKEIRKDYESGKISEKIGNMRELSPRKDGICNTLTTVQKDNYIFDPSWFAIRKLIPLECFRLMGFSDKDFSKAKYYTKEEAEEIKKSGKKYKTEIDEYGNEQIVCLSDSQAYKQAGNSIVTNVLYEVYKELYLAMPELFDDLKLVSLFSGIGAFEKGLDMFDEWRKNPKNFTIEEE